MFARRYQWLPRGDPRLRRRPPRRPRAERSPPPLTAGRLFLRILAWADEQLVRLCVEALRVAPALLVIFGGIALLGVFVQACDR